jgi:prepilin-type N-terminal cleavage/methylation domain-containing protein/prepilin-type processing-associated H-X9-DG protein
MIFRERKAKGFTLVELLVVIAIMAVLLTLLTPALQKARSQAQAAVCLAHEKQFGVAWRYYADDNDDVTFVHDASLFWFYQLGREFGDKTFGETGGYHEEGMLEIFQCPGAGRWQSFSGNDDYGWGSYGSAKTNWRWKNAQGTGADGTFTEGSYCANDWMLHSDVPGGDDRFYKHFSQAKGDTPLLSDGGFLRSRPVTADAPYSIDLIDLQGSGLEPSSYLGDSMRMSHSLERILLARHGRAGNVVFQDSHAERVPLEKMWSFNWHRDFVPVSTLALPSD